MWFLLLLLLLLIVFLKEFYEKVNFETNVRKMTQHPTGVDIEKNKGANQTVRTYRLVCVFADGM